MCEGGYELLTTYVTGFGWLPKGMVPCPGSFCKTGDIIKKMGDVTHFMEGHFYVGCRFISISYFLIKVGE